LGFLGVRFEEDAWVKGKGWRSRGKAPQGSNLKTVQQMGTLTHKVGSDLQERLRREATDRAELPWQS
jgi:hypothetical protein